MMDDLYYTIILHYVELDFPTNKNPKDVKDVNQKFLVFVWRLKSFLVDLNFYKKKCKTK